MRCCFLCVMPCELSRRAASIENERGARLAFSCQRATFVHAKTRLEFYDIVFIRPTVIRILLGNLCWPVIFQMSMNFSCFIMDFYYEFIK